MEIYIVYDPLLDKVISAHKSENGAAKRCQQEDDKDNRSCSGGYYWHKYDKYILED